MWPQNHRCLALRADWRRTKSRHSRHTSVSSSRGRIMKVVSLRLALHPAILIAFSAAAHAQDKDKVSQQELQAKIDYCKTCHGLTGQGYRGFYPMPRLAGQQ